MNLMQTQTQRRKTGLKVETGARTFRSSIQPSIYCLRVTVTANLNHYHVLKIASFADLLHDIIEQTSAIRHIIKQDV